jgi:hypothetical protein
MSSISHKNILKLNLITIYNNYNSFDLISIYRNLLKYNNDIRKYIINEDLYENYRDELYNIIDEYAYGNEDNYENIKKDFIIIIEKIINNL